MKVKEMNIDGEIYVNKEQFLKSLENEKSLELKKIDEASMIYTLSNKSDHDFAHILKMVVNNKLVNANYLDPHQVIEGGYDARSNEEVAYEILLFQLGMALRDDRF